MSQFKSIKLKDIHIPDRLRAVEDDHALAIQASIVEHGLLNPITVRKTPNAKKGTKPFTLVAGAHRLRAVELLDDEPEIDAIVVQADALEGQLIEIEENVFRNDLSVMDRAIFIQSYRDVWEKKHGKINPKGGRPKNSVNLTELISNEAAHGFSSYVAERLGLSTSTIERANQIAKIPASFREKLRGTPAADNQSLLLKFAKLPPSKMKAANKAFKLAEGDAVKTLELLEDKPKPKQSLFTKAVNVVRGKIGPMSVANRRKVFQDLAKTYGDDMQWALKANSEKSDAT